MSEAFAKIDALFKREISKDGPGAALAVLHHGELVYKNAWGLASIENPLPLTTQSVFNTGSIAKLFTAYALLYLQQQRKLSLEDELRKHIPEFPYYGIPTRLRHLLWHTSGIRCYTTLLWWAGVPQRDNYSRKQALELICRQKELNFASGSEYLYGNSNYLLLSEVVQRVSGRSIGELCKKLIFEPLGMTQTHFREDPSLPIPGLASGHMGPGGSLRVNRFLGSIPGVGRLMSSVEDLAKLEQFFLKPRKQEQSLLRLMLSPGWLENGSKIRYGGGIMLQHYRGQAMQRHDGFTAGHRAEYCRFPDQGVSLVCMANSYRLSPTWMIRQCANLLFPKSLDPVSALGPGQPAAPPARFKMSPKALAPHAGLYREMSTGAYMELSTVPGGLHFSNLLTGFDLLPERPGAFQGQGSGAIYRMDFEEDGSLILLKQGRVSRYERVKVAGKLSDEKLEKFVGRYACPEMLARVDVLIQDGTLVLNDGNGNEWPLKSLKGGRFFNYFRDLQFSKKGLLMEAPDAWVRRLKWVKLLISPFAWLDQELQGLEAEGMLRRLRVSDSPPEPLIELEGKQVLQLASNNYLGLATHPLVIQAASKALKRYGSGSGASRLISGTQRPHADLESALAAFKGAEAALVYATGSLANMGLLPSIAGPGDLLLLDKLCHATLYDGAKLSGAELQRFPHQDTKRLAELCKGSQRKVIVVEGVYSMDGDIAPLPEILALAEAYQAIVVVDEAHSTGVLGPTGRGILEHFGLAWHPNLVITGTLSKALGSLGGFVAGPQKLIDWLVNSSRSFIFATALPASCAAAALQSLQVIQSEPERLHRLRARSAQAASGLKAAGWDIGATQTPIIPVTVGAASDAVGLQQRLWDSGYFAPAIRPPTVPAGACRLRLSISSEHTEAQLAAFLKAIGKP